MKNNKKILYVALLVLFGVTCTICGTFFSYAFEDNTLRENLTGLYDFHFTGDKLGTNKEVIVDHAVCSDGGNTVFKNEILKTTTSYQEHCDIYINVENIPAIEKNLTGYYADTDDDGTIDGVIFFDYTVGADTTAGFLGTGVAVSPITEGLNTYELKTVMGHENVVVPTSSDKQDRFYVIDMQDSLPTTPAYTQDAYWYYSAYGKIRDYATVTSTSFGSGKTNTSTMKTKWNSGSYGTKNNSDMWSINMGDKFIMSKDEWLVLGSNFKKLDAEATYNMSTQRLDLSFPSGATLTFNGWYWSSSLFNNSYNAFLCFFSEGYVADIHINDSQTVRLALTF